jgi:UPF0755 protein
MRQVIRIPKRVYIALSISLMLFAFVGITMLRAPGEFPEHIIISIEKGSTLSEAAGTLQENNIVRSQFWFTALSKAFGGARGVIAGDYFFANRTMLPTVISRLINGDFGVDPVRITIPEGAANYEIAEILNNKLVDFDTTLFISIAEEKEGYLFPDTYLFSPIAKPTEIIEKMEDTFFERIVEVSSELEDSEHPLPDVLVMASLLEKEARKFETMQMIAGILWKRLSIDMALQVDAVFGYIKGTGTFHPSFSDLEVDSPYNTYKYVGLPPGPIGNPGLNAIRAALTPKESPYLYYLTGNDGVMRYSKSFEEHVDNKRAYLN